MDRMLDLLQFLADRKLTLGTVESLTGGMFVEQATAHPGASHVVKGALVTYRPEVKSALAGVSPETIKRYGIVSEPVAKAMALGGKRVLGCDVCISCTGNAGPSVQEGGAAVGDVFVSVAYAKRTWTVGFHFGQNATRGQIREMAVDAMVELALSIFHRPQMLENPEFDSQNQ